MDNSLEQIKLLNLTDEDFKLLVDGLDALPEKGMAGELMGDLLGSMMADKANPESIEKFKRERDQERAKKEKGKEKMREDIKILQGKLLMLKRYLQENKLLSEAYEAINLKRD